MIPPHDTKVGDKIYICRSGWKIYDGSTGTIHRGTRDRVLSTVIDLTVDGGLYAIQSRGFDWAYPEKVNSWIRFRRSGASPPKNAPTA